MAQRLHNLSKWIFLRDKQGLRFENARPRLVKIDVNCPGERQFYIMQLVEDVEGNPELLDDIDAGREDMRRKAFGAHPHPAGSPAVMKGGYVPAFLGLAHGRDRFEFEVDGEFVLVANGGDCYVHTVDSIQIATWIDNPEIFTRLANRRERNPQLEYMQYQMQRNREVFEAGIKAEMERRLSDMEARYAPQRALRIPSKVPARAPAEPGSGDAGASAGEAGEDAGKEPARGGDKKPRKAAKAAVDDGDEG